MRKQKKSIFLSIIGFIGIILFVVLASSFLDAYRYNESVILQLKDMWRWIFYSAAVFVIAIFRAAILVLK